MLEAAGPGCMLVRARGGKGCGHGWRRLAIAQDRAGAGGAEGLGALSFGGRFLGSPGRGAARRFGGCLCLRLQGGGVQACTEGAGAGGGQRGGDGAPWGGNCAAGHRGLADCARGGRGRRPGSQGLGGGAKHPGSGGAEGRRPHSTGGRPQELRGRALALGHRRRREGVLGSRGARPGSMPPRSRGAEAAGTERPPRRRGAGGHQSVVLSAGCWKRGRLEQGSHGVGVDHARGCRTQAPGSRGLAPRSGAAAPGRLCGGERRPGACGDEAGPEGVGGRQRRAERG
mmetsp:Transcript_134408/g.287530  ORF Transcript_134408/g.287530 Transcript_134408/m.287530 type:complete len:285 (-) Transcript_134408:109-963(-)